MFACETVASCSARLARANGFDAMRHMLALAVVVLHAFTLSNGGSTGMPEWARILGSVIVPSFFVLSGYLVASSLSRAPTFVNFIGSRLLRIVPALIAVVAVTALLLGPLLTRLSLRDYAVHPGVPLYLSNVVGQLQFHLPGVFEDNPRAGVVNGSLWTIPLEFTCYALLGALALLARRHMTILLIALSLLLAAPTTPFLGLLLAWLPAKTLVLAFVCGALMLRLGSSIPMHPVAGALGLVFAVLLMPHAATLAMPLLAYGMIWLSLRQLPLWKMRADYSYGFYLTAYPLQQIFIAVAPQAPWWGNLLFAVPMALIAAGLLWHGVEYPILSRKHEILSHLRLPMPIMAR